MNKVDFSIELPDMKQKLETLLGMELSSIPMRWIKGDTLPHKDKAEKLSKIYMPGETYMFSSTSALIVNWIDAPHVRLPLQFTNNAQVYYKSNSLSSGSGGVRNYRRKQRKT